LYDAEKQGRKMNQKAVYSIAIVIVAIVSLGVY